MDEKQYRDLYLCEFKSDPFHALTSDKLQMLRDNKLNDPDTRKRAKHILIEREQRNGH